MDCDCRYEKRSPGRQAGESFYRTAKQLELRLSGLSFAAYLAGDSAQRWAFDRVQRDGVVSTLGSAISDIASSAASVWRTYTGESNRTVATGEIRNNLYVFQLVRNAAKNMRIPAAGPIPLMEIVSRAYRAGTFPALWLVEGLGHDWASRARELGRPMRDLLTAGEAAQLPDETLTMMHAGIGLSFAEFLLPRLTPLSSPREFHDVLAEFTALCENNSRPGYAGCAFESLGLVTRVWHPELRDLMAAAVGRGFSRILGFFWHGVGRALFFNPVYVVPGIASPWREADGADEETARLNMRAGLTWAFTLVNMRQPELIESLVRDRGPELERDGGFADGVASSLVMRHDTTPDDAYVNALLAYRPRSNDAGFAARWERLVLGPAREAIERYHPVLKRCRRLDQVFHYQPLPEVVRRLEPACPAS